MFLTESCLLKPLGQITPITDAGTSLPLEPTCLTHECICNAEHAPETVQIHAAPKLRASPKPLSITSKCNGRSQAHLHAETPLITMLSICPRCNMSQRISCVIPAPCHPANPRLHTAPLARTAFESREPALVQGKSAKEPAKRAH